MYHWYSPIQSEGQHSKNQVHSTSLIRSIPVKPKSGMVSTKKCKSASGFLDKVADFMLSAGIALC